MIPAEILIKFNIFTFFQGEIKDLEKNYQRTIDNTNEIKKTLPEKLKEVGHLK